MCRQWLWDDQGAASLVWVVESLQRSPSTLASVVLLQAMSRTVDNGQGNWNRRGRTVDLEWELVCEHLKGAGSMLHYSRDTIHILRSVNLRCVPGSDIHLGHNISHAPWNWAKWLPGPGKPQETLRNNYSLLYLGCWGSNYQIGRDLSHCDFEFSVNISSFYSYGLITPGNPGCLVLHYSCQILLCSLIKGAQLESKLCSRFKCIWKPGGTCLPAAHLYDSLECLVGGSRNMSQCWIQWFS